MRGLSTFANPGEPALPYKAVNILVPADQCVTAVESILHDDPETWGADYKDAVEPLFPAEYEITKLYSREGTFDGQSVVNTVNAGVHVVNHMGHASDWMVMWVASFEFYDMTGDESDVSNGKDFCFVYSQGCYAGCFDNDECVGENFVRSAHGAFAVVMNSRYGWFEPGDVEASPSQKFDYEFWDAVFAEGMGRPSQANQDSKEDSYGAIAADTSGAYRWCCFELNLLGDPETTFGGSIGQAGRVFLDKARYGKGEDVAASVMDVGLDRDRHARDSATVTFTSTAGDAETLTLRETGDSSGVFTGRVVLADEAAVATDGALQARNDDTFSVTYVDDDDGFGQCVTNAASATADFVAPLISNVRVRNTTDEKAVVTWKTDEPALSHVAYGNVISLHAYGENAFLATNHTVVLAGLTPETKYYFTVHSEDEAGNDAVDGNAGERHSFATMKAVPLFVHGAEEGGGGWTVGNWSISAL